MKFFATLKNFCEKIFSKKAVLRVKKYGFSSNLILGFLIISVAFACLYPINKNATVGSLEEKVYRKGNASDGVSLMFNVYSDTKSVYKILETLEKYEAKVTFFVGGCWADDNVDCLKKIVEKGHELGNHGFFHKDHATLSQAENVKEISLCSRFVEQATGQTISLFAPPSGAYDENTVNAVETLKMKTILWSRDTIDWRDKNAATVYTRATKDITGGEFVLMHPTEHTALALEDILDYYKSRSLRVITVSENLRDGG
jgi:peptidoglycan/xylan/chitin deacetylase (PgdA/CDA1 family)